MARKRQRDRLCARAREAQHWNKSIRHHSKIAQKKKMNYIHMRHCFFFSLTRTLTWRRVFIKRLQKWIVFVTRFWVSISRYDCVRSAHLFLESFFYVCYFVFIRSSVAIVIHSYCIFILFPSTVQVKRKHTETKKIGSERKKESAPKEKKKWQKQKRKIVCANIVCASMTYALAMPNRFSVESKTKKKYLWAVGNP